MTEEAPLAVSFTEVAPPPPAYEAPPKREAKDAPDEPKKNDARTETSEEKPKRGRPRKDTRARTTKDSTPPAKNGEKPPLKPKDFTEDLTAITDALWLAGSQIPPTAPYAALVKANQAGLVQALNAGANQNHTVRNYVEKLSGGGNGTWALQLGMVGIQIGMQGLQLARDKEFRDHLVQSNAQAVQNYLAQFQTPEAQAAANPES